MGCLIAICFCKKVVYGKWYRFSLWCVPQVCKGLIHTHLSTLVLVFAVHLFILLVDFKDKATACHQLSIHLLSNCRVYGFSYERVIDSTQIRQEVIVTTTCCLCTISGGKKPLHALVVQLNTIQQNSNKVCSVSNIKAPKDPVEITL